MKTFPTDRRTFLAGSAALIAGSTTLADDPEPVRVAVVGTGSRGCDLLRALSTIDSAEIVALCDSYQPHLAQGQEYAGPTAKPFSDLSAMLRQTRPQALVIATPLDRHFEMALEALDAGCSVFCEKTMCYDLDQARKLAETVESKRSVFQVGLQRRSNAIYRQALAMVQTGMLGRISSIECRWHRNHSWRRPVPLPRNDPKFPDLEQRLNWRLYRNHSRGLMAELASHQLDVATSLLGSPPKRAVGRGGIDYWRDGREVFDNIFCIFEYDLTPPPADPAPGPKDQPYTVRVTYSSIQTNAYEGASETILGTRGTLFLTPRKGLFFRESATETRPPVAEGPAQDAAALTSGKTLKVSNDPWAHRGKPFEIDTQSDDTRDELVAFLDCVRRQDPKTVCDARQGLINTATVLMGDEALHESRLATFPI
jgi:predicted dehydrogenase